MSEDFTLPEGAIGRFAVVKLWPEIKTAEDECIARLKLAAQAIGVECVEIYADGGLISSQHIKVSKDNVDFVIHLHYDTPKNYDAFSFVALWNPLKFYHEWGYNRCSRNLTTHDDFISCSSDAADDHVARMVRKTFTHLPKRFYLYHSTADVIHSPSLGDGKLFYAGINWEAISGGKSRHQEVLKRLDKTGLLRIYGPSLFQGVQVWAGYDSYVREVPFDGVSMVDEIAKAGVALVLSSQAHKESELMSNRLFESVAAGALVICDENNFAKKFFGESLLYIDSRCSVEEIFQTIESHLAWAKENPDEALAMVAKAQEIFRKKFTLKKSLSDLYNGLSNRKLELIKHQRLEASKQVNVRLYLLMPEYSEAILNEHIASIVAQEYENFTPVLIIDKAAAGKYRSNIENTLAKLPVAIDVLEVDFFAYGISKEIKVRRRVGAIIAEILELSSQADAVVFVAPNEKIFSNHLQVLAGSLIRNLSTNCAATAAILKHTVQPIHGIHERIDFRELNPFFPIGYARFIFRVSALPKDLNLALPYLDRKSMAVLVGDNTITQELPATVIIDLTTEFPPGLWNEGQENELISSYCPAAFTVYTGHEFILPPLALSQSPVETAGQPIKRLSWNWVIAQTNALRRDGLEARFNALKRKLKVKLV